MEYIKEICINEAVIHVLDNNAEGPILNEYYLELNEEIYNYLLKHIERCLKDEALKYALFDDDKGFVKRYSQEYLTGERSLLDVSKELANKMFEINKSNGNISSCDLLAISISTEYGPMLVIMRMDYIKNYNHNISVVDGKLGVNIITANTGLPISKRVSQCALIKAMRKDQEYNLLILDKGHKNDEEYGARWFTKNYIQCSLINNERDLTRSFLDASESFVRKNINDDAAAAEKIRRTIKEIISENEQINIDSIAEDIFSNSQMKDAYLEVLKESINNNEIIIDKNYINKKLSKIKLQVARDIEVFLSEEAYKDKARFEVIKNGDGSINLVIKNVLNYTEN